MSEANAFFLIPILNLRKLSGVACSFAIFCSDRIKKTVVDELLRSKLERIIFMHGSSAGATILVLISDNISDAEETHRWIKELDGVEDVRMNVMREGMVVTNWLDEEIERHCGSH
jgi:hypothetical protein